MGLAAIVIPAGLTLPAAASDLADLISACAEGRMGFEERVATIEALGYSRTQPQDPLWVEAQVAHIAMSELQFGGDGLVETYHSFRDLAASGQMFRDDQTQQSFANATRDLMVSLSLLDGAPGCSIAFGVGAPLPEIPLTTRRDYSSNYGAYTTYRIGRGGVSSGSVLSSAWDTLMPAPRRAAGFLVVSQ
ncbi:hypothetical protein V8J83_14325 [Gymnodinialimonas sp. 2307UL20-7]